MPFWKMHTVKCIMEIYDIWVLNKVWYVSCVTGVAEASGKETHHHAEIGITHKNKYSNPPPLNLHILDSHQITTAVNRDLALNHQRLYKMIKCSVDLWRCKRAVVTDGGVGPTMEDMQPGIWRNGHRIEDFKREEKRISSNFE
ncbi:hypothetical protein LXL04_010253 [Taraxacum kok-saghyz]